MSRLSPVVLSRNLPRFKAFQPKCPQQPDPGLALDEGDQAAQLGRILNLVLTDTMDKKASYCLPAWC
jgi:hypothetical protein